MSPDTIPQISLGTAGLVIFAFCAGFVMLRGIGRMIVGTLVLALSAWVGFIVWQESPAWSLQYLGRTDAWLGNGLPVAAFLASFMILRWIAKAAARPFGRESEVRKKSSIPLPARLFLALIPTVIICLIGATVIHHIGTVAELRAFAGQKPGSDEATSADFSQRLKQSISAALPDSWLGMLDPLADPARLALAKEITSHADAPRAPVIDPATGQPIPRAIIVDDPQLQNLARKGKFGTLLRHPLLDKGLEKPTTNNQ